MSRAGARRAEPGLAHPMRDVVPITLARARSAAGGRPAVERRTDAELDEAVRAALHDLAPLVGTAIRCEARDGVLVLTGTVDADAGRRLVVEEVGAVPGVRVVLCGIVLRSHPAGGPCAHAPVTLRLVR